MTANVITIARTLGAGGEKVGWAVAEHLGYRYIDDDILTLAAEQAGVDTSDMARVEGRRPLVDKVVRALAIGGPMPFDCGAYAALAMHPASGGLEAMIVDVVARVAADGRVVVVAHGGGRALGAKPGVLRCLITAPPSVRACRVAGGRRAVDASDKARREFFRRFFDDSEHHDDYDLVLNTERLRVEDAAEAVVRVALATP